MRVRAMVSCSKEMSSEHTLGQWEYLESVRYLGWSSEDSGKLSTLIGSSDCTCYVELVNNLDCMIVQQLTLKLLCCNWESMQGT